MHTNVRQLTALALLTLGAVGSIATSPPDVNAVVSGSAVSSPVHLRLDAADEVSFEVTAALTLPESAEGLEMLSELTVHAIAEDESGAGQLALYACDGEQELVSGAWAAPDSVWLEVPGGLEACEAGQACVVEICGTVIGGDVGALVELGANASLYSNETMETGEAGEVFDITLDLVVDVGAAQ